MITINNIKEMKKYYDKQTNTYIFDDDVKFTINIDAWNIDAWNIDAWNINAHNIKAWNINAYDIYAYDIEARDIKAWNINAHNIKAWNIYYYAYCIAYHTFKCKSAKNRRINSICKCLDKEIEYIK